MKVKELIDLLEGMPEEFNVSFIADFERRDFDYMVNRGSECLIGVSDKEDEGYPFPDNVKVEFEEYCRGCKMCELEPINFTSGKQIYRCIHSLLCDGAFNLGIGIEGEIREGCRNDETEVEE